MNERRKGRKKEFRYRQIIPSFTFYADTYEGRLMTRPNKKLGELPRVTLLLGGIR